MIGIEPSTAIRAAALWTGLHLPLLIVLSVLVVLRRRAHQVGIGDGGVPDLLRASRAFGNAAEYIPAALVALVLLALVGASAAVVHGVGATLLAGRLMHAVGLSRSSGASLPRMLGMVLTFTAYGVATGALLFYAL